MTRVIRPATSATAGSLVLAVTPLWGTLATAAITWWWMSA